MFLSHAGWNRSVSFGAVSPYNDYMKHFCCAASNYSY